ncbi:ABC transporter permease [Clostridium pasteurianum]|uniref:ABC-type transport system, involved in lipoprotein release, permease component n=1 Tax=Clostridium pasteurianum BC1 TaxID=86416 RepID=R4JYT8_CLOPA|nr:ABC transporter permease [Clostridium pasteurianum]AGK95987.1 ABC-type transport system, involved in lipoprotein release, permease component [Clostridium pasteurianum BC1]
MWWKKLKKKKLQCFLIGILLFLSSLIFTSSLSMLTSIQGYVNEFYSNDKFYDLICYNANESSTKDVLQWGKSNSAIEDVKAIEAFTSGNDLYHKGKNLKLSMYDIMPIEDIKNLPFGLNKGDSSNNTICPKEGEVWITKLLADNYNIAIGDSLTFKTKTKDVTLKVTSLINDSLQPSPMIGIIILYINKNSAQDFSSFRKATFIFIDNKKGTNVANVEKDLTSAVKVGGFVADKDLLILGSTSTSSMIGGASTLASILVFIVSVLLIRFILWNNILKEYKSIGIYKALGFSKREILKFYIIGYSITAFIGSILGALCSIPILNYTASKILKYIGDFQDVNINFKVILATIILFPLVVIINLYFVIKRTNKISPVEALRTGVTSSREKLTKSLIKNTTFPLALAINDMFKYKKVTALITLTLTLSLSLVLLFGNFNVTMSQMKENTNIWLGLPKSNVTISAPSVTSAGALKEVLNEVKKDNRVKNYAYGSIMLTGVELDTKKYSIKSTIYNVFAMNSYNNDLGFTIIEGHNPENSKEVAVSLRILKEAGLSVGDYIELSINNKKASYLISGSYSSMMSNGYGIRILNSAVEKELPEFIGSEIFVNLKAGTDIEGFKKYINNRYSNLDASDIHPLLKYNIDSIPGTMLPMSNLLTVVFIAFCSITILNIIIMNIRDNRRNFGIMKALGFTTKEIRNRYLYRILILTLFSTIISILLNLTVARPMIAAVISNLDVLIISPITMLLLITAMVLLILVTTLICCTAIKNTKPTELMEE